jgi:serine/threonine protein kinase
VEGISLEGLLERLKTIPPPAAVHYLMQICSGLDYAHQRDIIHLDINTTNIFVRRDDRIKILDFGLACPIGTEDMTSFGTTFYMAPEQIGSEPLDQRTDLYAFTAIYLLPGQNKPFHTILDTPIFSKTRLVIDIKKLHLEKLFLYFFYTEHL